MRNLITVLSMIVLLTGFTACGGGGGSAPPADDDSGALAFSSLDGSTDVAVDATFQKSFDSAIDTSTVDETNFFIVQTASSNLALPVMASLDESSCVVANALDATVTCSSSTACVLDPSSDLAAGTSYTLCLVSGIEYADADSSLFIRSAYAAENVASDSVSFRTAGTAVEEIPDVSGFYSSDDINCLDGMVLESPSDNVYAIDEFMTLEMTGSTTCEVTIVVDSDVSVGIKGGNEGVEIACSYETDQFTLVLSVGENSCPAILTKNDDVVCGDGECDLDGGESVSVCGQDCNVEVTDLSFMDGATFGTVLLADDCLDGLDGNSAITFGVDPEEGMSESYFGAIGRSGYFLRISRETDDYCHVRFEMIEGEPELDVECAYYISSCSSSRIAATCSVEGGTTCSLRIESR